MAMGTGPGGPEINVTPLIDVLLVLLIISMLLQTAAKSHGEAAQVPQSPQPHVPVPDDPRAVVIRMFPAADGGRPTLRINQEAVSWAGLHDRLLEIYAPRAERVAFIQAERDVDFEYVADVIDAAHAVAIDKVGLMPPEAAAK